MNEKLNVSTTQFISDGAGEIIDNASLDEKVFNIVKGKPDGTNAGEIAIILDVTKNTILKVLRTLEAEREIYSAKIGNTIVWYPNGRLIHPYLELFVELRGKPYRLSIQESKTGPVIQVQERSYSLLSGERVEGAIFVEYGSAEKLIDGLEELKKRFENFEATKVKK